MATRAEVAAKAGVSETTVSYVLNNKGVISPETQSKVKKAISELGYKPNAMAQGLAGGKSKVIALLFPVKERGINSADFAYVLGASDAARSMGYHILLWTSENKKDFDAVLELAHRGFIDGALLMEVGLNDIRLKNLTKNNIPTGLIGRSDPKGEDNFYADRNFEEAIKLAFQYLYDNGHRRIGLVNGPENLRTAKFGAVIRVSDAFASISKKYNCKGEEFFLNHTISEGRNLAKKIISSKDSLTALICFNINVTQGIYMESLISGFSIPNDISLIDIATYKQQAEELTPPLTTISPPAEEIGAAATRQLISSLAHLNYKTNEHLFLGNLIERSSVLNLNSK